MAIDFNDLIRKVNDLPPIEKEKIINALDDMLEDYEVQNIYEELDQIKKEMKNGEYYTEDQINWDN